VQRGRVNEGGVEVVPAFILVLVGKQNILLARKESLSDRIFA
jgi:hypothetical protein